MCPEISSRATEIIRVKILIIFKDKKMAHKTTYENGFKAKVALEAVRGDKTIG